MADFTTIQVDRRLLARLKKYKTHPRQSYNEVIMQMISDEENLRGGMQSAQKAKMKELWGNSEDEAWEHA